MLANGGKKDFVDFHPSFEDFSPNSANFHLHASLLCGTSVQATHSLCYIPAQAEPAACWESLPDRGTEPASTG